LGEVCTCKRNQCREQCMRACRAPKPSTPIKNERVDVVGTRHVSSQLKAFLPQTKVTAPKIGCVRCGQSRGNGDTRNKPKKLSKGHAYKAKSDDMALTHRAHTNKPSERGRGAMEKNKNKKPHTKKRLACTETDQSHSTKDATK